ncbi:MAG: glycosyltransferase [Proteobacteria bacterium]|nr:glycosyltransferase [Pseudomonadota bacterium]
MNIGYFYTPYYPVTASCSVHGYCLMQALKKRGHQILSCLGDGNPDCMNFNRTKTGAVRLALAADVLYIRASALSNMRNATLLRLIRPFSLPVVWEVNAPVEELQSTLPPGKERERLLTTEKIKLKLLANLVDAGIGVSDSLKNYIRQELGIKKAYTIPNGSVPSAFEPHNIKKTCLEHFAGKFKVCWAGDARNSWQALDLIIEIAQRMEKTDPDILFVIITGESAWTFPVLTNLLVLRQVPFTDLPHYLAAADACLCLYRDHAMGFYNSPLKFFDYMAAGKPIIASPLGQLAKIIRHEENGMLTDNTVEATTRCIRTLKNDPALCKRLGANALQNALDYYNWDRVALETESVLIDTIKTKGHRCFLD